MPKTTHVGNTKIYIFGDSLSDNGNLYKFTDTSNVDSTNQKDTDNYQYDKITMNLLHKFFPNHLPPAELYCNGRFSDGYVWNEYLSQYLKVELVNYAVGGSTLNQYPQVNWDAKSYTEYLRKEMLFYTMSKSVYEQFDRFEADLKSKKYTVNPEDIVIILVGSNDIMIQHNYDASALVKTYMKLVRVLSLSNFKHIIAVNLPDLTIAPFFQEYYHKSAQNNSAPSQSLSQAKEQTKSVDKLNTIKTAISNFNAILEANLKSLTLPNSVVVHYDAYYASQHILYESFGDKYRHLSCYWGNMVTNYLVTTGSMSERSLMSEETYIEEMNYFAASGRELDSTFYQNYHNTRCKDGKRDRYPFYDEIHPSTTFHYYLAKHLGEFMKGNMNQFKNTYFEMPEVWFCPLADKLPNPNVELATSQVHSIINKLIGSGSGSGRATLTNTDSNSNHAGPNAYKESNENKENSNGVNSHVNVNKTIVQNPKPLQSQSKNNQDIK